MCIVKVTHVSNSSLYESIDTNFKGHIQSESSIFQCHSNVLFQVWASSFLPNEAAIKDKTQKEFYAKHKKPMLLDYVQKEISKKVCITGLHV